MTALGSHAGEPGLFYAYVHRAGGGPMRSRDAGTTWEATGFFPGAETPVIAPALGQGAVVASATTAADVAISRDAGRTWDRLLGHGRLVDGH